MKTRLKIDGLIVLSSVVFTLYLTQFPGLYLVSPGVDHVLDFFGFALIFKGVFIRMAARGHKMAHSRQGGGLVTSGLYHYLRNPMYLGTFLIGLGYTLILLLWWIVPVYVGLFILRFRPQVVLEENHLTMLFGKSYQEYCSKTPRIFPSWEGIWELKSKVAEVCPWEELWATKEKRGLWVLPVFAVALSAVQKTIVFHNADILGTFILVGLLVGISLIWFGLNYPVGKRKSI